MIALKYNTASQEIVLGPFLDSTDGNTAETGLTIANTDIQIWKNGATTLANKNSGGATHISGGYYYATLDATDTNTLGPLVIFIHVSGALAVRLECCVYPAVVYDAMIAGSDYLQVDAVQVEGSDATNQIRDAVVDDATRIDASALNTLSGHDPGGTIAGASAVTTVDTVVDSILSLLQNGTYGLEALEALVDELESRLTAARAGYLDELGSANIPADIDTLLSRVTDARMGALTDWIDGGRLDLLLDALLSRLTETRAGYLDAAISSRSTVTTEQVNAECDTAISDAALATAADLAVVAGIVDTIVSRVVGTIAAGTHNPQSGDAYARIGANGAGLSAVPWNASWDAEVQSECTDALNAYDPPTNTEMEARTLPAASYFDPASDTVARVTLVDTCTTNTDMRGTDSAYTGTPPTAAAIRGEIDSNSTQLAAIKAKTDNLPGGIPKNVALSNFYFFMVLSSDHYSGATGKTITAQISKDGGAFAACTNAPTELSGGVYVIDLTQAEMNADIIQLLFTETECDARTYTIKTDA